MENFEEVVNEIKKGITDLASSNLQEMQEEAVKDGQQFVNALEDDLKNWTRELSNGDLSQEDFEDLVKGKRSVAVMTGLKQKGLAQAKIDSFTDGIISLVIGKFFDALK